MRTACCAVQHRWTRFPGRSLEVHGNVHPRGMTAPGHRPGTGFGLRGTPLSPPAEAREPVTGREVEG